MTLGEKLDPRRFTAMSPKMAAIVACILGDEATFTTEPSIRHMVVTSDGGVLAVDDFGLANEFIGSAADLERNLAELQLAAELTPDESDRFDAMARKHITDWRYA